MIDRLNADILQSVLPFLSVKEQINFTPNQALTKASRVVMLEKECVKEKRERDRWTKWVNQFIRHETSYIDGFFKPEKVLRRRDFSADTRLKMISYLLYKFPLKRYSADFIEEMERFVPREYTILKICDDKLASQSIG